jgi:hypothetical protein
VDTENELGRAKWLLMAGLLFLVSCFLVYDEVAYALSGREAQATVTKSYLSTSGRPSLRSSARLTVEYAFAEPGGGQRKGMSSLPADAVLPQSGTVAVRYTPGEDGRSRLAGHVNWWGITMFGVTLLALGVAGFRLWREAAEATRTDRPRSKR